MQGTVVMLMALSGLGCHNKSCDVVYAPPALQLLWRRLLRECLSPRLCFAVVLLGVLLEWL